MFGKIQNRMKDWERRTRESYSHDIVDPVERKKSARFAFWHDHGILRHYWHNFSEVAPGFYRSNQPDPARFDTYAKLGIQTVVNLRGANGQAQYNFEVESCAKLGMTLVDLPLGARASPSKAQLLEILDMLDALRGPTLIHCKSGADRTGLVSAIYLIHCLGRPPEEALKMLSIRFVHLNFTKTGILDYVMTLYAQRAKLTPLSFRDWVLQDYDPVAAKETFDAMGFWQRIQL